MKRFSLFVLLGFFLTISLMGCNAMHGAGKDISNAGKGIQHASD